MKKVLSGQQTLNIIRVKPISPIIQQTTIAALNAWADKALAHEGDQISSLFAPHSTFSGTMADRVTGDLNDIKIYMSSFLKGLKGISWNLIKLNPIGENFCLATGSYTFEKQYGTGPITKTTGHFSFIVDKEGKLRHHHSGIKLNEEAVITLDKITEHPPVLVVSDPLHKAEEIVCGEMQCVSPTTVEQRHLVLTALKRWENIVGENKFEEADSLFSPLSTFCGMRADRVIKLNDGSNSKLLEFYLEQFLTRAKQNTLAWKELLINPLENHGESPIVATGTYRLTTGSDTLEGHFTFILEDKTGKYLHFHSGLKADKSTEIVLPRNI